MSRVPDDLVQIVAAQRESAAATSDAFIHSVTMGFLMLGDLGMFRIPVLLKFILRRKAMAMEAVAPRRSEYFPPAFRSRMVRAFLFPVAPSMGWGQVLRWSRCLDVPQQGIDRNPET